MYFARFIISTITGIIACYICRLIIPETYSGGIWTGIITLGVIIITRAIYNAFTEFDYEEPEFETPTVVHLDQKEQQEYKNTIAKLEQDNKNLQSELNVAQAKAKHCDEKIAYEQKRYEDLNKDLVKVEHERDNIWKDFQDLLHKRK